MLNGKLVSLRPVEREDLPNYIQWVNDPEVLAYFGTYLPYNLAKEEAWFDGMNKDASVINFAIEYEGRHVGGCGFIGIDHRNQVSRGGVVHRRQEPLGQGPGAGHPAHDAGLRLRSA